MQFQHVIADARSELGDTYNGSYSYSATDMMRYAVDGVREAWRVRPSLKYDPSTGELYDVAVVLTPAGIKVPAEMVVFEGHQERAIGEALDSRIVEVLFGERGYGADFFAA